MKNGFNAIIVSLFFASSTQKALAQTPFDSFDTLQKQKAILQLPEVPFRTVNGDTSSLIRYLEFDKQTQLLKCLSKDGDVLSEIVLKPNDFKWLSTDPLSEKYPSHSPYNFVVNNPINAIDPDGRDVELIIGKPYTDANGEEHPYGHMALRVFNKDAGYDKVYDFGRYGEVWGIMDSKGDGVLNVYSEGQKYIESEQQIRESVGYTMSTSQTQDEKIIAYFTGKTEEGEVYKSGSVPNGGGTAFKLKQDYDVLSNNCVTNTADGLKVVDKNILGSENDPRDALKTLESSYKSNSLLRTEYKKGGSTTVTYNPKQNDSNGNPKPVFVAPGLYINP